MIPADALVVVSVNWRVVRGDGKLLRLVKGTEFKKVFAEVNVREEEVTDLAVFGDGSGGARGSAGMLLSGSFDADGVIDLLKKRGWKEETYEGRRVYVSPADGARVARLDASAIVCGTMKGVEGVIRADSGAVAGFTSTDAYRRLSPLLKTDKQPVSMMIAFPQQLQDAADAALHISSVMLDFACVGALGQLMSKIGYSRAIGCSIGREGDSFPVKLVAVMKDEDAAALVSGGLTLLRGIGALAGQAVARTPEEAEALRNFQNMTLSRERDVLSIGIVLSGESLFPS
jgi:hypothetical protein